MKLHLSSVSPKGGKLGVKACQRVPPHIKMEVRDYILGKAGKEKAKAPIIVDSKGDNRC